MSEQFDVIAYLASKGHQGRQAAGHEVTYACFFDCQEPADSRKKKLYVNSEEGFYDCKVCGATGGTTLLQRFFGDEPVKVDQGPDPSAMRRIRTWAADVGAAMLANNDDILMYLFNDRGLSAETIVERKLGWVGKGWSLTDSLPEQFSRAELKGTGLVYRDGPRENQDFFYNHLLIPYVSRGQVVQVRGKVMGAKYFTPPGDPVRLYNIDALEDADEVLICEGEFDAMVVAQHLGTATDERARKVAVIGLAGANGFKEEFQVYLSKAKRIYIGLDPDDTGKREALKLKEMLGLRARIIELPSELPKCDWCADEETEALTRRGWLRHDEVEVGDDVWSLDPQTRRASWAPVAAVFSEYRNRTMIRLQAQTHDSLTTPDHRWLTQRGFVTTRDLLPSDRLPLTADSDLPQEGKYDDALVALVAWYYTEGHVRSAGVSIAQAEPRASGLRALLQRLFGSAYDGRYMDRLQPCWRERLRDWGVIEFDLNARAAAELRELCPDKTPTNKFLSTLTEAQLDIFIDISVDCDGWRRGRKRFFVQADVGRRDAFVTACALRGLATRVSTRSPGGYGKKQQWIVSVLQRREARVASLRREEVSYSGIIWCPSVPGRSTWFARRNGKSFFTGNTDYLLPIPAGAPNSWKILHPHAGHDWRDVMSLIGTAAGKRLYTMREAGVSFRTQQVETEVIRTGYVQFDSVIGGMKPGQVFVILAKTGSGKTLLLCNMAYYMRNHRVLFISLEMTREEVYDRLARIYLFHHPRASEYEVESAMNNVLINDENRLGERDLTALVDEYEVETGARPEVVMVDYLGYYARGAAGNSPYEKTTNAVMQLKAEAKAGRFVCISPAQVNRGTKEGKPIDLDDARDSGAIEETADFLVSIWRPDEALMADVANVQQSGKVKLTILKSRHGGKDRTFTLVMDMLTLAIVDDGTRAAVEATRHNHLAWRGDKWEDLRREQLRPIQIEMPYRRDLE